MDGESRLWAAFWTGLFATIVSVTAILCTLGSTPLPVQKMAIQSEHILKRECVRNKGEWRYVETAGGAACSFIPIKTD